MTVRMPFEREKRHPTKKKDSPTKKKKEGKKKPNADETKEGF